VFIPEPPRFPTDKESRFDNGAITRTAHKLLCTGGRFGTSAGKWEQFHWPSLCTVQLEMREHEGVMCLYQTRPGFLCHG